MAEITSVREININNENIKIEFMYIAKYNKNKTYFSNLNFDTAEGQSDDSVEYLNNHLEDYLDHNYLRFYKGCIKIFRNKWCVDNIKFIDKHGCLKVYRKEFENKY